ncbi:ion channel activity [Ptychographa xylographoides]|nr:ion channel activity [Ptychographa xylographoides]
MSGNQALNVNAGIGGTSPITITVRGSDWYWAVCAIMTTATLAFMGLSFTKPRRDRIFHYITAAITLVAAIAYFSMGSGLGQTPIPVEFIRSDPKVGGLMGGNREIFYVRYIDWFVTTPLLLTDLLLTAGMPWPTIMITILVDEVMIVTGLVGALTHSSYKWGYFVFGCLALFYVVYVLVFVARRHAAALGPQISRTFLSCGVLTIFLWFLYPIAWGLAEGGNVIAPDSEAVFYGILDILAKPVFGTILLLGHRSVTSADLGLHIQDYEDMPAREVREKTSGHHTNGTNGVTNGTNGATTTTTV